jgi:hypothetical protein
MDLLLPSIYSHQGLLSTSPSTRTSYAGTDHRVKVPTPTLRSYSRSSLPPLSKIQCSRCLATCTMLQVVVSRCKTTPLSCERRSLETTKRLKRLSSNSTKWQRHFPKAGEAADETGYLCLKHKWEDCKSKYGRHLLPFKSCRG